MKCLILGGGGFIGHHLARRLQNEGNEVHIVDVGWWLDDNHDYHVIIGDLVKPSTWLKLDNDYDEVYHLAADMGGAEYIFTQVNDAKIMLNSLQITMHCINWMLKNKKIKRVFFSSSACVYNQNNQMSKHHIDTREQAAYPAYPDSDYGWEKLTSERLYLAAARNKGLQVRIGRYHNVYGPESDFEGIRAKSVAALARKVIQASDKVEIFGNGEQVRSFLYIDDCIDATIRVMRCNYDQPLNIGSNEAISINQLVDKFIEFKGMKNHMKKVYVDGPVGVNARNSHNDLIQFHTGWYPATNIIHGLEATYKWIEQQLLSQEEA